MLYDTVAGAPCRHQLAPYPPRFRSQDLASVRRERRTQDGRGAEELFDRVLPDVAGAVVGRQYTIDELVGTTTDRKSTHLNSSHVKISYAVFSLEKQNEHPAIVDFVP